MKRLLIFALLLLLAPGAWGQTFFIGDTATTYTDSGTSLAPHNTCYALMGSGKTRTAAAGDTVRRFYYYGASDDAPNETVYAAIYTVSGGVPVTLTGSPAAISMTQTSGLCSSGVTAVGLADGVTYCVAVGQSTTEFIYFHRAALSAGRSNHTGAVFPATWSEVSTGDYTYRWYARGDNSAGSPEVAFGAGTYGAGTFGAGE